MESPSTNCLFIPNPGETDVFCRLVQTIPPQRKQAVNPGLYKTLGILFDIG
jgi:hypothetical protein